MPINWFLINSFRNIIHLILVRMVSSCLEVGYYIQYDWLLIIFPHRHRHGDNLPVIRRHLPRLIRARKESNPERGQRGEPPPQQLCHDPHLRSHERWDTDKEGSFLLTLCLAGHEGSWWTPVCAFSKHVQLFWRPFIFLLVFVCRTVRNHLHYIALLSCSSPRMY